jgi:hypothetical protein
MPTVKLTPVNLTPEQRAVVEHACTVLQRVLDRPEFYEQVRGAKYSSTLFVTRNGTLLRAPTSPVDAIIASGVQADESQANPDEAIDLTVTIANLRPGAHAFTLERGTLITIDLDYFEDCLGDGGDKRLAALLMHEWMHCAGFVHATATGHPDDVPSMVERIVEQLANAPLAAASMATIE